MIERITIKDNEAFLRQISKPVDFNDKSYLESIKLLETFCNTNECFAMASVQIGLPQRIVYLKNTNLSVALDTPNYNERQILINPEIISKQGKTEFWEACVSCLDNFALVERPYKMKVKYFDESGKEHTKIFEGFESTVLSHELDYLDGIFHMDRAIKVIELPQEARIAYREKEPYKVISKEDNFEYKTKELI